MFKRVVYVGFLVFALLGSIQARKKVYEQGKLVDFSAKYIDFPALLSTDTLLPPPRILVGYEFQIQLPDNSYFINVAICCHPPSRQYKLEWAVGDPVQFRMDKHKLFVRRPNGKELNARLVKIVPGIVAPSLSPPPISHPFPLPLDETPRSKQLPLTIDFLRAEDKCLILFGGVGAGDFFDHVRARKTAHGVQFRRGSQVVATFPESLVVSIIAVLGKCSARERTAQADDMSQKNVRFDDHFMESVTFDGSWKEGLAERPAELGPLAEGRIPTPIHATNDRDWWKYQFKVKSEGVSLGDALVIVIYSPDGKMLARFSARLTPKS